ncbi:methyl-accepting chemotaxis protein [Saccharospirillum mangrovi]|uniref:methyl-accepting chemotaxis protein n=1 Tax=Saccharospirillum mangrovi TaxID=2161747 RepID=UPI000D3B93CD|nr:methyl-accepting chemotaxis protein [Saccharospirillum mangrovi]
MLRRLNIGLRLTLILGTTLVLLFGLGLYGLKRLSQLNDDLAQIDALNVPTLIAVSNLDTAFMQVRTETANLMSALTSSQRELFRTKLDQSRDELNQAKARYAELIVSEAAQTTLAEIEADLDSYWQLNDQVWQMVAGFDNIGARDLLDEDAAPLADAINERIQATIAAQQAGITQVAGNANSNYQLTRLTTWALLAVMAVLIVGLSWRLTRSVTGPLREAVQVANAIAGNDLTSDIQFSGRDEATELMRALARMQSNLRDTLASLSASSKQLSMASDALSDVTHEATRSAQRQSEEIEMAATAVTELTAAIEEVAGNANNTADQSRQADERTRFGLAKVDATLNAIESLVSSVQSNAESMETLAGRVTDVGSVLEVIGEIADQTNLLALNAAIEAARAGEHGRGFAVVAEEVRGLAQRTADSIAEIENIIQAVQSGTATAVGAMRDNNDKATHTLTSGREAAEALSTIATLISDINDRNMASASAAEQQASVAKEVDRNLVTLRDLSNQTAEGSQQVRQSSDDLAQLAATMNAVVARFQV